jgi:hypothetical protein
MALRPPSVLVTMAVAVAGCAKVPPVSVNYFLPKTEATVEVNRTLACTDTDRIIMVESSKPATVHSADTGSPQKMEIARANRAGANSSMTFEFYEDGRLKSLNSTSTGQGAKIFETAFRIAAAARRN